MHSKRWLVPALIAAAALVYVQCRRRDLCCLLENLRRYSAPSASLYDAATAFALRGFFARLASELAEVVPRGQVLEVGSGPGRLAVKLAQIAPGVQVTGLDISPEMVELASSLAARSDLGDRVQFRVGDIASLPFPDASFDAAVSTFSLHHWGEPARGLAEIRRVLRPGGVAMVYDVADWIGKLEMGAARSVRGTLFEGWTLRITHRLGPVPLVFLAQLRRE